MKKKALSDLGLLVVILVFVCFMWGWLMINTAQRDNVCKELGFEKYRWVNDIGVCEDSYKNLHYVNVKCKWFVCSGKLISVGDVRTTQVID